MDFLDWIKDHRNALLNTALVIAALTILVVRYYSNDSFPSHQAETTYEAWMKDPQLDESSLQALRKAKLSSTTYAHIAQELVARGEGQKAEPFAKNSLEHLRSSLPEYAEYAEEGLLIANGKFEEALGRGLRLKETLASQNKTKTLLYRFNLVRLVSLAKQLQRDEIALQKELESLRA